MAEIFLKGRDLVFVEEGEDREMFNRNMRVSISKDNEYKLFMIINIS